VPREKILLTYVLLSYTKFLVDSRSVLKRGKEVLKPLLGHVGITLTQVLASVATLVILNSRQYLPAARLLRTTKSSPGTSQIAAKSITMLSCHRCS
jgi:hypothetical protein